ncbi:MAG: DUF5721 family protein [Eubacteriales bacterium]
MITLKIIEIKPFMEKLFKSNVFDDFEISNVEVSSLTDFKITGTLNKKYLSSDEIEIIGNQKLIQWNQIKDTVFHMIKGQKTPLYLKIIFSLSPDKKQTFIEHNNIDIINEQVNGLFINLKYDRTALTCTTGTSLQIFTKDKTLEQLWDKSVEKFFNKHNILFE